MSPWVLIVTAGVVGLLAILEGKRQERKYGKASGRPNLAGVGMLELQKILQPDRDTAKLEMLQKEEEAVEEGQTAGAGSVLLPDGTRARSQRGP